MLYLSDHVFLFLKKKSIGGISTQYRIVTHEEVQELFYRAGIQKVTPYVKRMLRGEAFAVGDDIIKMEVINGRGIRKYGS